MNSYYQPQSVIMIKQSSQMNTPILEDSSHILAHGNFHEQSDQQLRIGLPLSKLNIVNQCIIKDKTNNIALEGPSSKNPFQKNQLRKYSISQNRGSFPDYQANSYKMGEEGNQKNQDLSQMISKIGEKIKNKTEKFLEKSSSRLSANGSQNIPKLPPMKSVETSFHFQKNENLKLEEVVNWVKIQILKIEEKVTKNQIKIDKLEKNCKKNEQSISMSSESSMSAQFKEINTILSLVQKAENRDDYRKSMKMIEQLRENILELHGQLASIKCQQQSVPKQAKQIYPRKEISSDQLKDLKMHIDEETNQLCKKIQCVDDKYRSFIKEYQNNCCSWTTSMKQFDGKMITLHYQEIISSYDNQGNLVNSDLNKYCSKSRIQTEGSYKENSMITTVITSKTYYLDPEGYLLDKDQYYLLNKQNQQIKLSDKEIELLKHNNLI